MAYRKNSNLHQLAYALEKRADFLEDAKDWISRNPELAAGLLGGGLGAGAGALVPTGEGGTAGDRVRNALIGLLLGGGTGALGGALYRLNDKVDDNLKQMMINHWGMDKPDYNAPFTVDDVQKHTDDLIQSTNTLDTDQKPIEPEEQTVPHADVTTIPNSTLQNITGDQIRQALPIIQALNERANSKGYK